MFKKIIILAIISLVVATFGVAMAQDATDTSANATASQEETITAQDLGVSEPTLLPDSKFYFLKNWKNAIQSVFTFGQEKKAELNLKIASVKLLEAQKLAEKTSNPRVLEKATNLYNKQLTKIQENIAKFKGTATSSEKISNFLDKYVKQQILQNQILEKLEGKVPTSTMERIKENRENHLEKFGQVMQKLEDKNKIQERLQKALNSLKEKFPSSTIEKMQEKIKNQLPNGSAVKQKLENIKEKLKKATTTQNIVGGDKDEHGCIGSAGYSWCEIKQKCLRVWEEKCGVAATSTMGL